MSATMFVFIGYLVFIAFSPVVFDLGFYCTLILIALFVDLFWVCTRYLGGIKNVNS